MICEAVPSQTAATVDKFVMDVKVKVQLLFVYTYDIDSVYICTNVVVLIDTESKELRLGSAAVSVVYGRNRKKEVRTVMCYVVLILLYLSAVT